MKSLEDYKAAAKEYAAKTLGSTGGQRRYFGAAVKLDPSSADVGKLPQIAAPPLIVMDPASPDFGKFLFMAGYSSVGGGDVIR